MGRIFSAEGINYIVQSISNIGKIGINIIIALILSIFFLLEKDKIIEFTSKFRQSKISGISSELEFFGENLLLHLVKLLKFKLL